MRRALIFFLIALVAACGDTPEDYTNREEIRADLNRLYAARKSGDRETIMAVSDRIFASARTAGAVRMPALLCSAEILAKEGQIEKVEDLFKQQFSYVMKSNGNCSQAVYTAMKADVWQAADRLDLAVRDYRSAVDLCPTMDNGYSKMAVIYATSSDPAYLDAGKAIALAEKAVTIKSGSQSLYALATAHAASRDYLSAATHMAEAIRAGEQEKQPDSKMAAMREALARYQTAIQTGKR